jgi:hypothetical protein
VIRAPSCPLEHKEWLRWLADKVGGEPADLIGDMPYHVYGVVRGGRLLGVVLWTNYRDASIEAAWAGVPGWLTRAVLRDLWSYPFVQLRVRVVTGLVKSRNTRSQDIAERMGCRRCGVIPRWYEDDDAVVYAMTADTCRWIDDQESAESVGPDADGTDAGRHERAGGKEHAACQCHGQVEPLRIEHVHA